jgi:hypothetical protein
MSETSSNASSLTDLPYTQRQFAEFYMAKTVVAVRDFSLIRLAVDAVMKRLKSEESHKPGIKTIRVPIQQATSLSLPPGHPQTDVLYVAHPSDPAAYLPVADFHRLTFEHKFAEAIRLLMHLGARTISVTHTRGWDHEFAGKLSAGIPQVGVGASAEASIESESSTRLLYEAELTGHNDPQLPDDLVWYPHEPTWQSAAEARLEFGLQRFSLKLQYTDDYGVNADLAVGARNVGFSLGGSFEKHQKTVWSLEGTFGG